MAKPRRKHPGLHVAEGSPQGEVFVSILMSFLGEELWWKAVEQTRDKSIIFAVGGSRGQGVLVEGAEQADGEVWVNRWGFRHEPDSLGVVVQMELTARRWDPWLHAELTGDRTLLQESAGRRRREQELRSWEAGKAGDRLHMTVLPVEGSARVVCGVPLEQIEEVLKRHAEKEGEGAREVGMIRPETGNDWERDWLLGGDFPVVD